MTREPEAAGDRRPAVVHPVLAEEPGGAPAGSPLGEAHLTDRQRIAVLLQAGGLLSLLERWGERLPADWSAAVVAGGRLFLPAGAILADGGASHQGDGAPGAQDLLRELLLRLFAADQAAGSARVPGKDGGTGAADPVEMAEWMRTGHEAGIAGRGEARRAARALLAQWWQPLVPARADEAVEQILAAAPFLWRRDFAAARQALTGELPSLAGSATAWVAGGSARRRRLLASGAGAAEVAARLGSPAARSWWEGRAGALKEPASLASEASSRVAACAALAAQGRFTAALAELGNVRSPMARLQRALCQLQLGRLGAARLTLRRFEEVRLPPAAEIEAAEAALRAFANSGEPERLPSWVERALAAGRAVGAGPEGAGWRARAHLVAALAAWDRQAPECMDEHLAGARAVLSASPSEATAAPAWWRYHQACGLRAMAAGEGGAAVEHLTAALQRCRRRLCRHEAAGLWNDLGIGRVQRADLAGAERAFQHAQRLFAGCDGPRRATLALLNLAEVRLRRGRLTGVREILARSTAENRRSSNLRGSTQDAELLARYHLVVGQPAAATAVCREAIERLDRRGFPWRRDVLALLMARALGWQGRAAEAARELAGIAAPALAELEPEELPALWAAAGRLDEARRAAAHLDSPAAPLWRAVLAGQAAAESAWDALGVLGPYRAARLVFDLERAARRAPTAPPRWLRDASLALRQVGATTFAEWLDQRAAGPWEALARYATHPAGDPRAAADLLRDVGGAAARLRWRPSAFPSRAPAPAVVLAPSPFPEAAPVVAAEPADADADHPGDAAESAAEPALAAEMAGGRLELICRGSGPGDVEPAVAACFALAARDLARAAARPVARDEVAEGVSHGGAAGRGAHLGAAILGSSPVMRRVMERLERVAAADIPVLIRGESGTGKELAARQIHRSSRRRAAPFLAVNCAALAESLLLSDLFGHVRGAFTGADRDRAGVFETARGGTVLLDEIGDLPLGAQGLLLRFLQEGEVRRLGESLPRRVDVRVLAATHRSLEQAVAAGTFREDLFYRIKVGAIDLPPLRDRGDDLLEIAQGLLARQPHHPVRRLSAAALDRLRRHAWPGNVRELENVLRLAAALADDGTIRPQHLDLPAAAAAVPGISYHQQVESLRRRLVADALSACGGRHAEAARRLRISRQALSYLVGQLGLLS